MKFKRFDSSETRRFIKFSIVGAIGFIIDTGALNIMIGYLGMTTSLLRLIAKTISFTLALTSNFFWNRYWIYPDSRSKSVRLQAVQFTVVNLIGLALNLLIFGSVKFISFFEEILVPNFVAIALCECFSLLIVRIAKLEFPICS